MGASTAIFTVPTFQLNTQYEMVFTEIANRWAFSINGMVINSMNEIFEKGGMGTLKILGSNTGVIKYSLVEIYNRALSASEIKLLYQQRLYTQPIELPLLLDFDSTQGILVDRTGRNTLTATNVIIQQIGKVKSAYFNGTSSDIQIPSTFLESNNIVVNTWTKNRSTTLQQCIAAIQLGSDMLWEVFFYFNGAASLRYNYNNTNAVLLGGGGIITKGIFMNIICVLSNNMFPKIYINGILMATGASIYIANYSNHNKLYIGNHPIGGRFKGYIPKIQIFSGVPSNSDLFAAQLFSSQKNLFL
jgi:hypothetical protein